MTQKTCVRRKIQEMARNLHVDVRHPLRPGKRLLVLDMDYTLLDTWSLEERHLPTADCMRPGLHKFLEIAYMFYDICIWSQADPTDLQNRLVELSMIGDEKRNYRISFLLDYSPMFKVSCSRGGERSIHYVKALQIIWERFPQFGPQNTVHVDDQSRNFVLNPGEGIRVTPFKVNRTRGFQSDQELIRLERYLAWLAPHPDFCAVDHKNWRQVSRDLRGYIERSV